MRNGMNGVSVAIFALMVALLLLPSASPLLAEPEESVPLNTYGWFDQVVLFGESDKDKALDMLIKGDMDAYFIDISDPESFKKIRESPELDYDFSYGLYYELTFNPVGPLYNDGRFNPFSNPKIREAINYVIDRDYIVDELMGGLGVPKYVCLVKALPEGQRMLDVIEEIEDEYAYDFEKGASIIQEEMTKMGATLVGNKWHYEGRPVVIKFIIRVEDARKQIGDYVATQLEKLNFTVQRMYKTSKEASPLWLFGDPAEGQWDLYTGGWITTAVSRDDSDNFLFFYTPDGLPVPLWQAYKPSPEFYDVAKKLAYRLFRSMDERMELMEEALWLSMKDSVRVWLVDQTAVWVRRRGINIVSDYAGGYANQIWALTMNRDNKMGGTARIASAEVIVDPWNPVAPSDWIYDTFVYDYALSHGYAFALHPKTGLPIPVHVKSVKMWAEKGTLTFSNEETKDWFNLTYVDEVTVPRDAWYGWDVEKQEVVTAYYAGVHKARIKFLVDYGNVLNKTLYHDSSVMTLADFIIPWILTFERANPKSPWYDEAAVPAFETWRQNFVAWRIVSTDPLKIEYYVNEAQLDAELIAHYYTIWPANPWHMIAIGMLAEKNRELAFSSDKAQKLGVEWMNYIAGPSLKVLSKYLDEALNESFIPFENFMKKYVTPEEAKKRYQLYKEFHDKLGHFWVGDGPYYLDKVSAVAHTATIKAVRLWSITKFVNSTKHTIVAFGYDKKIVEKLCPSGEVVPEPESMSLVVGGPRVNVRTKVAFEGIGISFDGNKLILPSGETFSSTWAKTDYGIATIIGDKLYIAGITRFGTEATLLYVKNHIVGKSTIVVKWEDRNGNQQVDLDEVSAILEKF